MTLAHNFAAVEKQLISFPNFAIASVIFPNSPAPEAKGTREIQSHSIGSHESDSPLPGLVRPRSFLSGDFEIASNRKIRREPRRPEHSRGKIMGEEIEDRAADRDGEKYLIPSLRQTENKRSWERAGKRNGQ